jgi:hypothetical protein
MLDLAELKARRDLVGSIDWEITPRQAFEAYQLRSAGLSAYRSLQPVHYFYLSTWRGENRVLLVRRDYLDSETVAEIDAPAELVAGCLEELGGQEMPRGQLPLNQALRDWLRDQLDG